MTSSRVSGLSQSNVEDLRSANAAGMSSECSLGLEVRDLLPGQTLSWASQASGVTYRWLRGLSPATLTIPMKRKSKMEEKASGLPGLSSS